jgi:hypothetical protein
MDEVIKVIKTSTDFGATCYIYDRFGVGECINFKELGGDGRIKATFNKNDWSAGDYTYAEDTEALYLTGTGEMLWQSERMYVAPKHKSMA